MTNRRRTYRQDDPCPVCGGWPTLPQGKGVRCYGFIATGARSAFCTREEHAGAADFNAGANAWKHRLFGPCACGIVHGEPTPGDAPPPRRPRLVVVEPEPEPLGADTLSRVYTCYLELCPLRQEHIEHLATRGAVDLAVGRDLGYGSLPLGYTASRALVDALLLDFGMAVMTHVPGFYLDRRTGRLMTHTATASDDAIVVPARDEHGHILALIRMRTTGAAAKYRVFKNGGGDLYTVAGNAADGRLWFVDGIHKAHVAAHHLTTIGVPQRIMGLPGAHLSDAHLAAISRLAPAEVIEALDADKFSNAAVARQQARAHATLTRAGHPTSTAVWELEDGKGLDDLLVTGGVPRFRTVAHRPEVTARLPEPTPNPAPLPAGRPLSDVQRETEREIGEFIAHRRRNQGHVKVIAAPAGVGKTTAAIRAAIANRVVARIGVATKAKAEEIADAYPDRVQAVQARNTDNCSNFDTVEAARRKGHDVAELICKTCPFLSDCRDQPGRYYNQFKKTGTLVGASEMLFSGAFLRHGEVVIADDADLGRVMVDTRTIGARDALQLAQVVPAGPLRELLTVIQRAVDHEQARAGDRFMPPQIGPAAWDALARAAGGARRLLALIEACPSAQDLLPAPSGPHLTADDIDAAPPAVLARLIEILRRERAAFARGTDFNSGLSLHRGGLELRSLRPPLWNEKEDKPVLKDKAVLILDATPLMPLVDHLSDGLHLEPVYAPTVTLPANVAVTQIADRFHGKTSVNRAQTREDGSERRPGRDALLASLAAARADYPGDREAALCAKSLKEDVVAAGIPEERVLTFYGNRGLNSIEDADVVHLLGRPQAPDWTALQLAHVLHQQEAPIIGHLTLTPTTYAGYRAPDGHGRAVTVLDFVDPRVSAVFRQHREAEIVQSIHRARLFRVGDAQIGLFEPEERGIARHAGERRRVRVVIHSAHPIPGLRVDDLVYDQEPRQTVNEERAAAAAERIIGARNELIAEGIQPTVNAIARAAGADKRTVSRVLGGGEDLFRPVDTVNRSISYNGLHRAEQMSEDIPSVGERDQGRAARQAALRRLVAQGGPVTIGDLAAVSGNGKGRRSKYHDTLVHTPIEEHPP